jgi:anti-anti-sigma regulatory factor
MLRISYAQTETTQGAVQRWTLCGQLAGAWVEELRGCFEHHRQAAGTAHTVVDLRDVTFIDDSGEQLLLDLTAAGTEFVAAGVETRHLLENLRSREERPHRKFSVRSFMQCGKPGTGTGKETAGKETTGKKTK